MTKIRFAPLERSRASDGAVQQIRDMITSGDLKPGAKLPPERDLVQQLNVSRTTVREALRILEGMGLLEVKSGLGAFVTTNFEPQLKALWAAWLVEHKVLDLVEAREVLELRAARLAAERITEEELAVLGQRVEELEQHVAAGDVKGIVACDRAFHDLLCRSSRNEFIATLNASLYEALDETRMSIYTLLPHLRASMPQEHRAILEALQARDAEAAQKTVLFHMDSLRADIREVIASNDR